MKRRLLSLLLALGFAVCLLGGCGGSGASASSMRLAKVLGEVSLWDQEEKSVAAAEDTALYDGWRIGTEVQSFAWVTLDETKLTKLDEASRAAVHKDGKQLEIEIEYGSLFFNVTEPLAGDESLTIRCSDMTVGIRGTCSWVCVPDPEHMVVYLLEGTVQCTAREASEQLDHGELAILSLTDGAGQIEILPLTRDKVPVFVEDELPGEGRQLIEALPEPVPYAEEHGLQFSPAGDFSIPAVMHNRQDRSQFLPFESQHHIERLDLTDNGDGTETLTLSHSFTTMVSGSLNGPMYDDFRCATMDPWDMYTGLILENTTDRDLIHEVDWNGTRFTIAARIDVSYQTDDQVLSADLTHIEEYGHYEIVHYITYPKGYDGLAFFAPPVYDPAQDIIQGGSLLDNWVDGTVLIRASDLIAAYGAG